MFGSGKFSNNMFLLFGGQASLRKTDLFVVTFSKIILLIN